MCVMVAPKCSCQVPPEILLNLLNRDLRKNDKPYSTFHALVNYCVYQCDVSQFSFLPRGFERAYSEGG